MRYIKEMGDHYAVLNIGGQVVGTINRYGGNGMWEFVPLDGRLGCSSFPLAYCLREALKET